MDKNLKEIVILHSNDIHGKFEGEKDENGNICHSLALVSGYVNRAKKENPDTVYVIAGDVFQGSLIDSEYQGLSTMDILNLIDIDLMSLGNHELDYGISHMMFVSRYADFPILTANFRIKKNNRNLFKPYQVLDIGGFKVLFIGLITAGIVDQTKAEGLVGTFVTVNDSVKEVEEIVAKERAKHPDIDFTVLMTHIGYDEDLKLAAELDPSLGVKVIVGAHSHTYIDEPGQVNGILVLQVGKENTHLGELHLFIDEEKHEIADWSWKMVPVDSEHCPEDKFVRAMVNTYQMDIDDKYGTIVTRFKRELDNYGRGNTTEVGQLFVDAFSNSLDVDIMMMASSSTRCYKMDMTVTLQDLREAYPYDGKIYKVKVRGARLRKIVKHMLRDEVLDDWKDAFFHTSKELHIEYTRSTGELELEYKGQPVEDSQMFTLGLQEFYFINAEYVLGCSCDELTKTGGIHIVAEDAFSVLKKYLSEHKGLGSRVDKRIIIQ